MRPELHPACACFPPQDAIEKLADDILENGLRDPVTLLPDGRLLNGRGRWAACEIIGIKPSTVTYNGNDPLGFVIAKSKDRTDLNKQQWTIHVAKVSLLMDCPDATLATRFGVDSRLLSRAKSLLLNAEPHIINMIEACTVSIRLAHEAVKDTSRATQAKWTAEDVIRVGREVAAAYPSRHTRTHTHQSDIKSSPVRQINVPYGTCKFPTAKETGAPPPGSTLAEHDQFFEKYGRVALHPKTVKEMLDCDSQTGHLTQVVASLANPSLPDAESYLKMIDQMLTWVPQSDKKNGEEKDYARMARTTLARMEKNIIGALNRLTELKLALDHRNSDSMNEKPYEPALS